MTRLQYQSLNIEASANQIGSYLDFVALRREGLLDGLVEVAPRVDDEKILRHFRSSFCDWKRKTNNYGFFADILVFSGWHWFDPFLIQSHRHFFTLFNKISRKMFPQFDSLFKNLKISIKKVQIKKIKRSSECW